MSSAVTRKGDMGSGHGCWPPRQSTGGSPNVFVNGISVHREGDTWASHTCPTIPETHDSVLKSGSSTVYVNGKQIGRIGDPVACGSSVATGSSNVFSG